MIDIVRAIATWFLLFLTYAFLGWLMEMVITVVIHRRLYNRGFLIGPLCPIYGVAGALITLMVGRQENILEIFCVVMILGAVIEYSTSYLMEKLFHARWWDYTDQPFNVNGRICLGALLGFGALGVAVVKFISPFLFGIFGKLDKMSLILIALVLAVILLCDLIASLRLIIRFRATTKTVNGDVTEEITEYIRSKFSEHGKLSRRLLKAFPAMEVKKPTPSKRARKSRVKMDKKLLSDRKSTPSDTLRGGETDKGTQ